MVDNRQEKIDKENRKRWISMALYVFIGIVSACFAIMEKINIVIFAVILGGTCGIFQIYNMIIHKRIKKIIWSDVN